MTEEARLIVAALRTSCEENGSCPDCTINYWCHAKNGERLEDAAADIIESLTAQLEQVEMERDGLNIMLAQAQAMLETRTNERDAAVADLKLIVSGDFSCAICGHYAYDEDDESRICADCDVETYSNWQWRGVQEVE